ncbi:MAG TPA: response regulator transcription factor [Candidatus Binataceae bacterium]|nr:response regulator transcription factor [Candidatus Binataceae bacterium]
MRLLLVEDDVMLGRALKAGLGQDQHATDWVRSVADARAAWVVPAQETVPYEAVIVDLSLPDGSGIDLIRAARARRLKTPVLIVTARDRIADRILGLDAGADDYMVKPIDLDELAARLRAIGRRANGRADEQRTYGALSIDAAAKIITMRGETVDLSGREYAVLMALVRRPGGIVSRAQLEEALYGWDASTESNTVEVYIYNLRRKLGQSTIQTQRGLGYRLVAPALQ